MKNIQVSSIFAVILLLMTSHSIAMPMASAYEITNESNLTLVLGNVSNIPLGIFKFPQTLASNSVPITYFDPATQTHYPSQSFKLNYYEQASFQKLGTNSDKYCSYLWLAPLRQWITLKDEFTIQVDGKTRSVICYRYGPEIQIKP